MVWTTIGFLYAVEWLSGNVPQERGVIDIEVLRRLANDYTAQLGEDSVVTLEALVHEGQTIGRYIQGAIDYRVYGRGVR